MTALRRLWPVGLVCLLAAVPFASAARAADDGKDEVVEETISGKRVGGLDTTKFSVTEGHDLSLDAGLDAYSARVKRGAKVLGAREDFVRDCVIAVEHLYHRRYTEAKAAFAAMGTKYPGSGISPAGQVLVWQALMLENFDYRYVPQYEVAARQARMELQAALESPGNDAWEHFLMGGMLGVDSIHTMRTGEYLKALSRGLEAMKFIKGAQEHAPEFVDAFLGDGLFNYWRAVIAMSTKAIPDLGDTRAKGISQMQQVEREGIFLSPAATLALVFTWMEEGDMTKALQQCERNKKVYPTNVINNLVHGRVYMYMRKHKEAEAIFISVIRQDPQNQRVHYYMSRMYMRMGDMERSRSAIDTYLTFKLDDQTRGYALYQKGLIDYRQQKWDAAEAAFSESWRLARLDMAKTRLDSIKAKRAGG